MSRDELTLAALTLVALVAGLFYTQRRAQAATTASDFLSSIGGLNGTQTTSPAPQEWAFSETQMKRWVTPAKGLAFEPVFVAAGNAYDLPAGLLSRVAYQESRYNPNAQSPVGALGLMQFMPATARDFGIDPLDANAAIWAAAKYLRQLYDRFGNWPEAIAAYNWGQGNVQRQGLDKAPKETRDYIAGVLGDTGLLT